PAPTGPLRAEPAPPAAAPSWSLKDPEGATVSSDQFKGRVVVLDFWATWCVPCRAEIPGYIELQRKYASDGLAVVGVSVDQDGAEIVKRFMKAHGINYTVVLAGDSDIASAYGDVSSIPTTFIIDRDGRIRDRKVGMVPAADFEKRVLAVLKPGAP
ncbi:MAG TPA: TlpA disulfide reductase family protein, partial [Opitutaceae bacterium]|nr:TlpA disulfide reductase family protein [Opitutaceae bacterium]